MKSPKPDVVAGSNVAFWAARQFLYVTTGLLSPLPTAKLAAIALITGDTWLTYQTCSNLMRLNKTDRFVRAFTVLWMDEEKDDFNGRTEGSPAGDTPAAPAPS